MDETIKSKYLHFKALFNIKDTDTILRRPKTAYTDTIQMLSTHIF